MTKSQAVLQDVLAINHTGAPLVLKLAQAMEAVAKSRRDARRYYEDMGSADVEGWVRTHLITLRDLLLKESTRLTSRGAGSRETDLLEILWDRLGRLTH
jgi:hypothetical protein